AVIMTIQMGIPVARIELLDTVHMRACNAYSGLSYAESPTLFLEILAEIRPVDEQRRKQRHKQHYDDHSTQKDEEPAYQCKASPFGILL
ncbi:hypothetical protein ACC862_37395, partial [Rhizobium ruizarguesonis]